MSDDTLTIPDPNPSGSIPPRKLQLELQAKLGSLYHRIYQLHNEQYHIYPPFNNYEQYRIYCTQRLSRLRHCNYKMVVAQSTRANESQTTDTTTTTTTTVVKSLLLHSSKYSNAIPPLHPPKNTDTGPDDLHHKMTVKQRPPSNQNSSSKRSGSGKHAYHSRKVVYENISLWNQSHGDDTLIEIEDVPNQNTLDIYYHENVIWNLFYQAERAWAQACALLQQQSSTTTTTTTVAMNQYKKKLSNHRHVQNRFNKAVRWSQLLYNTVRALLLLSSSDTKKDHVVVDVAFVQECYAYMKWMEGNAALEHKDYGSAYSNYSHSVRTLYELQQSAPQPITPNDYYEKWKLHIENVLRPLVRYCQYEMKGMDMMIDDEDDVLRLIDQPTPGSLRSVGSTTTAATTKIHFRNVNVTFDHQVFSPAITVAYLKLEPLLSALTTTMVECDDGNDTTKNQNDDGDSTRLRLMSDLDDLMSLVMKEFKMKFSHPNSSIAVSQQPQQNHQLLFTTFYSYLKYYKVSIWRRQQEIRIKETLLNNTSKSDDSFLPDVVHLYTTLQQIALSMSELIPTSMALNINTTTTGTPFDEDDPYTLEAQAHLVRVRAFRCYYLAQYYEMIGLSYDDSEQHQQQPLRNSNIRTVQQQQYVAARLLLQQSQLLTKRAVEEMSACEDDATLLLSSQLIHIYVNELEQLNIHIKAMFCRLDATNYLHQQKFGSSGADLVHDRNNGTTKNGASSFPLQPDRPLWMRYEEENGDEKEGTGDVTLADVPPLPIPLPCKGVFFDIAVQYIDEAIHDEVLQPLSDHCTMLSNASTTGPAVALETSSSSSGGIFQRWFSSK